MRTISTFLPAEPSPLTEGGGTIVFAFDTLVDQKSLVVGITVGRMTGPNLDDVRVSAVGQEIISRCGRHANKNYPQGAVVLAGVASVSGAKERVSKVLKAAPPNSFVLFLCVDDKVYDAATPALGINYQSASGQTQ